MKHSIKLLLAFAVLLAATGVANAETGKMYMAPNKHDIVRDRNGNPVRSTSGDCVRTQWFNDTDVCPGAEPPPVIIPLSERTVYFDFAKSSLTPAAKQQLDKLVATLKVRDHVKGVRIAGYADRIGSAAKNEKLSKKRADTVRKYLISKGVVNAQVIETRWFGDSAPATNCPKKMPKKKLIECLQPDRRVEVEVDFAAPAPDAK